MPHGCSCSCLFAVLVLISVLLVAEVATSTDEPRPHKHENFLKKGIVERNRTAASPYKLKGELSTDVAKPPAGIADVAISLLPPPPVPPAVTTSRCTLKIVTGGDLPYIEDAQPVIDNQRAFAQRQGYGHEVHIGNYAHPWIGYWHKIDVLLRELQAPDPAAVLVWMDLDMIVTDPTQNMFERILNLYPDEAVILTEDALRGSLVPGMQSAKRLVNTGIIIVRRGPEAVRVFQTLFEYGRRVRDAAYLPQAADTLHEQDAFSSLLGGPRKHVWGRHVAVIPQRRGSINLNTFARSFYETRYQDSADVQWRAGDFTAHCTGLRKQQREWCINESITAAHVAIVAEDDCRNETLMQIEHGESVGSFIV